VQKSKIFLTATGTGVGKTTVAYKLIEKLAQRGVRPGVFKAIETGVETSPQDAKMLLEICSKYNSNFTSLTPFDITAYTFTLASAPFCADSKQIIDISYIIQRAKELEELCDILIIEGAGGLMVPIKSDYFMIDLIKDLSSYALLVTPSKLGCINETLLSLEALKSRNIEYDWCVNIYEDMDSFDIVTKPFYDEAMDSWWSVEEGLDRFVDNLTLAR